MSLVAAQQFFDHRSYIRWNGYIRWLKCNLNGEVKMGEKRKAGEMLLPLGDLGAKVVVAHPCFIKTGIKQV